MRRSLVWITVSAIALIAGPMAQRAGAQDRPRAAFEFEAAWVGFADDGIVSEALVGGAARWYVLPRISVGPELAYISGDNHSHLIVTGNLTWDVVASQAGTRAVVPFLVVGGGVFRTHESFFNGTFTSSEGAFTAGGGVRALVGDRVTLGVDARIGWETHVRVGAFVGLQLH